MFHYVPFICIVIIVSSSPSIIITAIVISIVIIAVVITIILRLWMQFCSCNEEGPNEIPGQCSNVVLDALCQRSALCTLGEYTVVIFEAIGRKVSQVVERFIAGL